MIFVSEIPLLFETDRGDAFQDPGLLRALDEIRKVALATRVDDLTPSSTSRRPKGEAVELQCLWRPQQGFMNDPG